MTKVCPICGKEFELLEKGRREKVYCSYDCYKKSVVIKSHERQKAIGMLSKEERERMRTYVTELPKYANLSDTDRAELESKYGKIVASQYIGKNLVCTFKLVDGYNWKSFFGTRRILESVKDFNTIEEASKDIASCFR